MLFNSYTFIFLFIPITVAGFFALARWAGHRVAVGWLTACSLFFYSWWDVTNLPIILISIFGNYVVGGLLSSPTRTTGGKKLVLTLGVAANLAALGYYKYTNFLVDNINALTGAELYVRTIVLPLGISFFTFQQVAFLVDAYRGETKEYDFVEYALFVCFYPQLIAGPIVHHKEIIPTFNSRRTDTARWSNIGLGLAIFTVGLFKKVVIADSVSGTANSVFGAAHAGGAPTLVSAWTGALAYTFQIYFDFSGYSDMCVGLGRMLGVTIALNFNSPYKAVNIVDFWRRWHITLSRFLRDYLYIGLGGNRKGPARRYVNLFLTMLLAGCGTGRRGRSSRGARCTGRC